MEWLTGVMALVGGTIGASLPTVLGRTFQRQDQHRAELAELSTLLTEWEASYAQAATLLTIGTVASDQRAKMLEELKALNLHRAMKSLARAKFIAASALPDLLPTLQEVSDLDSQIARTFAEQISSQIDTKVAALKINEQVACRTKVLASVDTVLHSAIARANRRR